MSSPSRKCSSPRRLRRQHQCTDACQWPNGRTPGSRPLYRMPRRLPGPTGSAACAAARQTPLRRQPLPHPSQAPSRLAEGRSWTWSSPLEAAAGAVVGRRPPPPALRRCTATVTTRSAVTLQRASLPALLWPAGRPPATRMPAPATTGRCAGQCACLVAACSSIASPLPPPARAPQRMVALRVGAAAQTLRDRSGVHHRGIRCGHPSCFRASGQRPGLMSGSGFAWFARSGRLCRAGQT